MFYPGTALKLKSRDQISALYLSGMIRALLSEEMSRKNRRVFAKFDLEDFTGCGTIT